MSLKSNPVFRLSLILLVVTLCIWKFKDTDWKLFLSISTQIRWFSLSIAILAVLGFWAVRAQLLATLMEKFELRVPWREAFRVHMVGGFVDLIAPAKAGYILRWTMLSARFQGFKSRVLSIVLASFGIESLALVLIFSGFVALSEQARALFSNYGAFAAIGLIIASLFAVVFSGVVERKLRPWKESRLKILYVMFETLMKLRSLGIAFFSFGLAFVTWIFQALSIFFVAESLGIEFSAYQTLVMMMALNIATIFPILPGNIGTIQLTAGVVMSHFGHPEHLGLMYGLIFHATQALTVIVLALALQYRRSPSSKTLLISKKG